MATNLTSPLARRALLSTIAVASLLGLAACGSSSSPISSNTTTASTAAPTAASTTTSSTSATTSTTTPATTTPTTTKTTSGGGGRTKDNPAQDKAFCEALLRNAQKLITAGKAVSDVNSVDGKPSKQLVNSLHTMAQVFATLKPLAPAAVKGDVSTAAKQYGAMASAFASGNDQKMIKAAGNFESSNATNDLLNVETWETHHCA